MIHDGLERTYQLYVPASYANSSTAVPLVLNFHGYTGNSANQVIYADFRSIADRENFLIVHPQGSIGEDGETYWNAQWVPDGVDDIGFTAELIETLSSSYNIDPNRIYSTGMSNGGFMSYTLACELSDKIAAIASVTGSMTLPQVNNTCDPQNLTPIMQIHGTADNVVPYNGNNNWMAPIDEVLDFWRGKNNCFDTEIFQIENTDPSDDSSVEHQINASCSGGTSIELFKVIGGTHTWPGSAIDFGVTNYDINASEEIWRFFSQHDLNGRISSLKETSLAKLKLLPSISSDYIELSFLPSDFKNIRVIDMNGQVIYAEKCQDDFTKISIETLPSGIYLLQILRNSQTSTQRFVKI